MQPKSYSRAAERRMQRKQQIVDTASQLFSERGIENVTLRAIAENLGYAHAALYRYFPDKASLLAEICRETFDHLETELNAQKQHAEGPEAELLAVSIGVVRFGLAHPHHFQVVFSAPGSHGGLGSNEHIDAIGRSMFERLIQTFVTCSKALGLSENTRMLDASTWWISLFGATHILSSACPVISPSSTDEVLLRHVHVMWTGFRNLSGPVDTRGARLNLTRPGRNTRAVRSKRGARNDS